MGDPDSRFIKNYMFGVCSKDDDCISTDPCLNSKCDIEKKICIFDPLQCSECSDDSCDHTQSCNPSPCSFCGKTMIIIEFHTDAIATETSWVLKDQETDETIMTGSKYRKANTVFRHKKCITGGSYN